MTGTRARRWRAAKHTDQIAVTAVSIDTIRKFYGEGERASDWLTVEQSLIDKFGEATRDSDWLHTDPERAKRDSPFGGTIAFGFWTLSMLTYFVRQTQGVDYPPGVVYGLNYGFDRVRLITPVPVGAKIRCRSKFVSAEQRERGRYLVKTEQQIEVEGADKPALVAQWLVMLVYAA
jgi:acyl dehydratase